MGCTKTNETNFPFLLCNIEKRNEEQKIFCLKIRDTYENPKSIKYEIKTSDNPFFIKLKIKNFVYDIQTTFINNTDEEVEKILQVIYKMIDEK